MQEKEHVFTRQIACNYLESICTHLDFLVNPALEDKMVCDFGCCFAHILTPFFEAVQKERSTFESILEKRGMDLMDQFATKLDDILDFDTEKGFSQKPEWKAHALRIQELSAYIKEKLAALEINDSGDTNIDLIETVKKDTENAGYDCVEVGCCVDDYETQRILLEERD